MEILCIFYDLPGVFSVMWLGGNLSWAQEKVKWALDRVLPQKGMETWQGRYDPLERCLFVCLFVSSGGECGVSSWEQSEWLLGGGDHSCALGACLIWEPCRPSAQQERRQAERYPCVDIAGSGTWCCLFDTVTNTQWKDRWPAKNTV